MLETSWKETIGGSSKNETQVCEIAQQKRFTNILTRCQRTFTGQNEDTEMKTKFLNSNQNFNA